MVDQANLFEPVVVDLFDSGADTFVQCVVHEDHGPSDGRRREQVFEILAGEIPTIAVDGESDSVALVDLVVRAGLAKSKSEARRSIEQGGIYLNQQRIDDAGRTVAPEDWIGGRNLLLRKGKKEYALLRRAG